VHFVAESTTKFTLYFVPTFTTSTKVLLICTQCEKQQEFNGEAGRSYRQNALPQNVMLEQLRRQTNRADDHQPAAGGAQEEPPANSLAVGMFIFALQVALTDGRVDDAETAAMEQGFKTVCSNTQSGPVKQAAGLAVAKARDILTWINSPATGPIDLMLAGTGRMLRQLERADQSRYLGQLVWLCDTVAAATGGTSEAELDQMDASLSIMGFSSQEVAQALAFCDQHGG